ncbi:putative cellulose 1,4-beta-cellobiosidase II precursor [Flagelloscypha sp. PMI_526]|nr:putative cellulose 1,4-beta-cellobiosidase II precursor [Flagelloscypha sp. PMI_526]
MKSIFPLVALLGSFATVHGVATESSSIANVNPFAGHTFYNSPVYRPKVEAAAKTIRAAGNKALAKKALKVADVSTFMWLSDIASVPSLEDWLKEARSIQRSTRKPQIVQVEVYNLPDRDCGAKASAGELSLSENGLERYKTEFIAPIVAILKKYPDVRVAIGLETDAIGNFVTGQALRSVLTLMRDKNRPMRQLLPLSSCPNIALYLDGAHSAWTGWPGNIEKTAAVVGEIVAEAQETNPKAKIRGLATDVSLELQWSWQPKPNRYDELVYVKAIAPLLEAAGIPDPHFIVDQGRSATKTGVRVGGDWCNNKYAGFGPRPTTATPDPIVDAVVWVKPGGEGDGTSDSTSPRFDENCVSPTRSCPSARVGTWFPGLL